MIEVVRTHLEMRGLAALKPARLPAAPVTLERMPHISVDEYRALYAGVGGPWRWRDRLIWTDAEVSAYLASSNTSIWLLKASGETAGYFELQHLANKHVEIAYFGLIASFIGHGLGGWMLTRAVEESFAMGAERVTLHTCTLDSARALPNYLARGFTPTREERYFVEGETSATAAPQ